ncbi:MAG TPA: hypothetical protein VFV27_07385, partial [Nevskiaceae bacterium]|nr:hypothetical protein [Nevskiaceae bacterium]
YRSRNDAAFNTSRVVLTIEPGTVIYGEPTEALTIARGSQIFAEGTVDAPIVFTSAAQLTARFDGSLVTPADTGLGEWAGLALLGLARSQECANNNFDNCDRPLEGNVGFFGGNNDRDSSGSLKYVVIRHSGNDIDGNGNELNGLTMGSVGRNTRIQFVQIHKGFDDGIEFFGGNAFVSNLVVTAVGDDSIDYAQGWTGGVQHALVIQQDSASPGLGRGIEGGDDTTYTTFPVTFPLLANITILGPANRTDGGSINDRQGIVLRGGIRNQLHNSLVTGNFKDSNSSSGVCLDVDAASTFARNDDLADNGGLLFRNNIFDCVSTFELNG